jgi:hypothetical protein
MSVSVVVFLRSDRIPSPTAWQEAIQKHGFPVALDLEFDPASSSGFRPCTHGGVASGFEFYLDDAVLDGLDSAARTLVGDRNKMISLVTHSDMREAATSAIAAGVLAIVADGVLYDTEGGEFVLATDAVNWAREQERQMLPYMV